MALSGSPTGSPQWWRYEWRNADITALGAALNGDIAVVRLQPRTLVMRAAIQLLSAAAGPTTLTLSLGRNSPNFDNYLLTQNAKAAPPVAYGMNPSDLGGRMSDLLGDVPSLQNEIDIRLRFVATGQNLNQVTGSTGFVYLLLSSV